MGSRKSGSGGMFSSAYIQVKSVCWTRGAQNRYRDGLREWTEIDRRDTERHRNADMTREWKTKGQVDGTRDREHADRLRR